MPAGWTSKEGTDMTAVYTWDVFSTLDGYGSYAEGRTRPS
jgi:hypothetical protein